IQVRFAVQTGHTEKAARLRSCANSRHRPLLDHLVSAGEEQCRDFEAERLGGLEINGKLEQSWLLDRQLSRLRTTQNSGNVLCGTTPERSKVRAVADETAVTRHARPFAHGRQASL